MSTDLVTSEILLALRNAKPRCRRFLRIHEYLYRESSMYSVGSLMLREWIVFNARRARPDQSPSFHLECYRAGGVTPIPLSSATRWVRMLHPDRRVWVIRHQPQHIVWRLVSKR